jgi:hypothetical protein
MSQQRYYNLQIEERKWNERNKGKTRGRAKSTGRGLINKK